MGQQGNLTSTMLMFAFIAVFMYFFIMRPQNKKRQQHEAMLASISRGSEVITAGGFFGTVREVLDDSYIIELADGVKVRILKSSISVKRNEGEKSGEPKKVKKKKKKIRDAGSAETAGESQAETIEAAASDVEAAEYQPAVTEAAEAAPAPAEEENNEEKA